MIPDFEYDYDTERFDRSHAQRALLAHPAFEQAFAEPSADVAETMQYVKLLVDHMERCYSDGRDYQAFKAGQAKTLRRYRALASFAALGAVLCVCVGVGVFGSGIGQGACLMVALGFTGAGLHQVKTLYEAAQASIETAERRHEGVYIQRAMVQDKLEFVTRFTELNVIRREMLTKTGFGAGEPPVVN